jgi:hypothetical protein
VGPLARAEQFDQSLTPKFFLNKTPETEKILIFEALAKLVYFVILNEVKDLKLLKIRDSSHRSE